MKTFQVKHTNKKVAEGVQFSDGYVVVLWKNYKHSLKVYKTVEDLLSEDIYDEGNELVWN